MVFVEDRELVVRRFSRDQRLLTEVFWGVDEIWDAVQALRDVPVYISRNPYTRLGIPRERFLTHNVSAYFNEVYILAERIRSFERFVLRKYRKNPPSDLAIITGASRVALAAVTTTTQTRGAHVHRRRFKDEGLHSLRVLEIAPRLRDRYGRSWRVPQNETADSFYRKERARWQRIVREALATIGQAMDSYFSALHPFFFDDHEELKKPHHWPDA